MYPIDPLIKKWFWLIPWAVYFLLLVVLGAVRILGFWSAVPGSDTFRDGPQYLVKNTDGGADYQVGFPVQSFIAVWK